MLYKLYLYKSTAYSGDSLAVEMINNALGSDLKEVWVDADSFIEGGSYEKVIKDLEKFIPCNEDGSLKYKTHKMRTGRHRKNYLMLATSYEMIGMILGDVKYIAQKNGLTIYDPQEDRLYFQKNPRFENMLKTKQRAKKIINAIRVLVKPFKITLLEDCSNAYDAQISYAITISKDLQKSFLERTSEFWSTLTGLVLPDEKCFCLNECFHISGDRYTITFAFEGYKKTADKIGYIENGVPVEKMIHRMSCFKAQQIIPSLGYHDNTDFVLKSMRMADLVYKYPNPADRYVAICKIRKHLMKYHHDVSYDPYHWYGGDVRMNKYYPDGFSDDLTCSYLKIEEIYASIFIPCIEKYYPYFRERYYLTDNYLPDAMCSDILAELKKVRKMLANDPFSEESREYLLESRNGHLLDHMEVFWKSIELMDIFIVWLELQIKCEEESGRDFMIDITGP